MPAHEVKANGVIARGAEMSGDGMDARAGCGAPTRGERHFHSHLARESAVRSHLIAEAMIIAAEGDPDRLRLMSRVNDVGGQSGFGPIAVERDEPPFHADWEARVYALNVAMLQRGVYNLDQFRDAIERMPPAEYLAASYYERWLHAVETLTAGHG
jgi:hypothetical protein